MCQEMIFDVGKFYKHPTGHCLSIICEAETTMWGSTLVAESAGGYIGSTLLSVGKDEVSAQNYHEISKEEWMENFS